MQISKNWGIILMLVFLYLIIYSFFVIYDYQDPFPSVIDVKGARHTTGSVALFSIFRIFVCGFFVREIYRSNYGEYMSFEVYSKFKMFLGVYTYFLIAALLKAIIVGSLVGDKYSHTVFGGAFYSNLGAVTVFLMFFRTSRKKGV